MSEFREIEPEKIGMPSEAKGPHYPTLHFSLEHLPEAESWKNGETYNIALRVKQKGIMKSEDEEGKHGSVDFDIVAVKVEGQSENPEKEKEEKSQGSYRVRE